MDEEIRWTGSLMSLPEADARDVHRRLGTDGYITTHDLLEAIRESSFDENRCRRRRRARLRGLAGSVDDAPHDGDAQRDGKPSNAAVTCSARV